jgi:hypothetical protein
LAFFPLTALGLEFVGFGFGLVVLVPFAASHAAATALISVFVWMLGTLGAARCGYLRYTPT